MDESEIILQERILKLPKELREFIAKETWLKTTELLGQKYLLTPEQNQSLEYCVLFVLIGFSQTSELLEQIKNDLVISEDIALQIQNEIEKNIISTIPLFAFDVTLVPETLLEFPANLIEDSAGNSDNTLPPLPGAVEVQPAVLAVSKPELTQSPTVPEMRIVTAPTAPKEIPRPDPTMTDEEWEARKKALEAGDLVMKRAYGEKTDPYREAV